VGFYELSEVRIVHARFAVFGRRKKIQIPYGKFFNCTLQTFCNAVGRLQRSFDSFGVLFVGKDAEFV